MKTIAFVFGTRPEIIKLAPIILEMKKFPNDYNIIIIISIILLSILLLLLLFELLLFELFE